VSMMRKLSKGDYQIGIYAATYDPLPAQRGGAVPPWLVETGRGYSKRFRTLAAAYHHLTGEPLRQTPRELTAARSAREADAKQRLMNLTANDIPAEEAPLA
jgi:hypothetical protein